MKKKKYEKKKPSIPFVVRFPLASLAQAELKLNQIDLKKTKSLQKVNDVPKTLNSNIPTAVVEKKELGVFARY